MLRLSFGKFMPLTPSLSLVVEREFLCSYRDAMLCAQIQRFHLHHFVAPLKKGTIREEATLLLSSTHP